MIRFQFGDLGLSISDSIWDCGCVFNPVNTNKANMTDEEKQYCVDSS